MPLARIILPLLILSTAAFSASLRTTDGQTLDGTLQIEPGALVITSKSGPATRVAPADILSADFRTSPATQPAATTSSKPLWTSRDVGETRSPGEARFTPTTLTLKGAGDIGTVRDACRFVYQPLAGDGQLIARVASLAQTDRLAKAGLMFRASIDPAAPSVAAFATADDSPYLTARPRLGRFIEPQAGPQLSVPFWIKLSRRGNEFTASVSADGEQWDVIGSTTAELPKTAYAGFFVASRNPNTVATATFERFALLPGSEDPALAPAAAAQGRFTKGLLLRNGSTLAGQPRSTSDSAIKLARGGGEISVPLTDVAQVLFRPLSPALAARIPPDRPGVLLGSGDFFEGQLQSLQDDRLQLSSILFGLKRFNAPEIAAIILRPTNVKPTRYEVRLADGSAVFTDDVALEQDGLSVSLPSLKLPKLGAADLAELRAGPARFVPLTGLKPTRSDAAPDLEAPFVIGGQAFERAIAITAGSRVTYDLAGNYRLLVLNFGLPSSHLPTNPLRLTILADGKELSRTPSRTSLDDALPLALPVAGVKLLELRLEAATPWPLSNSALLGDPALLR